MTAQAWFNILFGLLLVVVGVAIAVLRQWILRSVDTQFDKDIEHLRASLRGEVESKLSSQAAELRKHTEIAVMRATRLGDMTLAAARKDLLN